MAGNIVNFLIVYNKISFWGMVHFVALQNVLLRRFIIRERISYAISQDFPINPHTCVLSNLWIGTVEGGTDNE